MDLLQSLKFVQGAVAKKDFVPSLTHFCIKNRSVRGFNGTLGICSPINIDLDVMPKAIELVKAINACTETIAMSVAPNGKLILKSGDFKSLVNCDASGTFPDIRPEGKVIELRDSLLPALRYLEPFIAQDASRPWACGILFDQESAFATNNIVLVQYWLGFQFPSRTTIPSAVVRELIRIGEDPIKIQISERSLTFHFDNGRWISTRLLEAPWPEVGHLFDKASGPQKPFPEGFFDALDRLLPFLDDLGRCYFLGDKIGTTADPSIAGTSIATACPAAGIFNARQLANLREIAETIAFENYPAPVIFYGKRVRGLVVGIRS